MAVSGKSRTFAPLKHRKFQKLKDNKPSRRAVRQHTWRAFFIFGDSGFVVRCPLQILSVFVSSAKKYLTLQQNPPYLLVLLYFVQVVLGNGVFLFPKSKGKWHEYDKDVLKR